jgi:nucleoside-diphosphate-sugar epimerase
MSSSEAVRRTAPPSTKVSRGIGPPTRPSRPASTNRQWTILLSSSVCIYSDIAPGEPELTEEQAFPALPYNECGWEKLYAERMALAYAPRFDMQVRIARFQNYYGPEGPGPALRKTPAAICRKVAEAHSIFVGVVAALVLIIAEIGYIPRDWL